MSPWSTSSAPAKAYPSYRYRTGTVSPTTNGDNVIDYCEVNGIAFIPWFPLGAGRVASWVLERIAKARQLNPIQIALAWLLKRSPAMLPIPRDFLDCLSRRKHTGSVIAIF
jgi:diketogulonate reductase-like aldo/keto reductase